MRILRELCALTTVAIIVAGVALPAFAADQTKSGAVDVSGVVPGPPPATPPNIDVPHQSATFTQKTIDVKGTCANGLIVRIFRNAIFAGSALCKTDGTFALQIDLTEGRNDLIARQYDSLNQSSPDSDTVTVFYSVPQQQPSLPGETPAPVQPGNHGTSAGGQSAPPAQVAQFQLIIDYDYSFRGVSVNYPFHLPLHFSGGTPPYAIAVNWGDGNTTVVSRETAEQFFVDHTFTRAGAYNVKIRISDKNGNTAFLQFVLIVNGANGSQGNGLFGAPLTFDSWFSFSLPALVFSAVSFMGGFFFSHYWQHRKQKRLNSKVK